MVSRHRAGGFVLILVSGLAASPAFAGVADCKKIQAPLDLLAFYDRLTNAQPASRPGKPLRPELVGLAQAPGGMPAYVGVLPPVDSPGKQWWIEAEQAFYSLSKGHSSPLIVTGDPTVSGPVTTSAKIPTSPGFIGLVTTQKFTRQRLGEQRHSVWWRRPQYRHSQRRSAAFRPLARC